MMTIRTCPDCKGARMVRKLPSAQGAYPSLLVGAKEPETFILCRSCKGSGYQEMSFLGGWKPHAPQKIVLTR
jgi:hypothetical protein